MHDESVIYSVEKGIAEIKLNRPQRLNAVTQELYDQLLDCMARAEADNDVRVIVIRGEGRAFCVGADLKAHKAGRTAFDRRQYLHGEQQVCKRLRELAKPVITAVHGYALGAGAEMAIAADFLLMSADAKIGFPEIGLGTFLGGGVTKDLARLVGLAKARELVFLGEKISARDAVDMGLANRVFADTDFFDEVRAFASKIATKAPLSMQLAKAQLNLAAERSMDAVLLAELEGMTFCATSKDWQEGIDAFAEKRDPIYQGK